MNENLQFAYPWVLFLLWLVPPAVAWWVYLLRNRAAALGRLIAPDMQARIAPSSGMVRAAWQTGLVAAAAVLLIVAVARPRWGIREETVIQAGRDLVIALDVSRSMLATDVHPSRLQRAKADLLDLIRELRGDRAALLAFRYKTVTVCPLTTDYAFLRQALESVDIDSAPRGETDIGAALRSALDAFDNESSAHKAIVLVSDGEDLAGRALEVADMARERRIPVFTVGIGSTAGAKVPDPADPRRAATFEGKEMVSKLNVETLKAIAVRTGGAWVAIGTAGMADTTLGTIYRDHLRKITAQELQETKQRRQVERFTLFLLPAVLFLLCAAFLSRGRLQTGKPPREAARPSSDAADRSSTSTRPPPIPAVGPTAVIALVILLAARPACPQTNGGPFAIPIEGVPNETGAAATNAPAPGLEGREGGRRAQNLFALGRYEDAARLYEDAAMGASRSLRRDLLYNAGIAYTRAGMNDRAAEVFSSLSGPGADSDTEAATGLAVARYRSASSVTGDAPEAVIEKAERLHDAAEAFRSAARGASEQADPKRDLEAVSRLWISAETDAAAARLARDFKDSDAAQMAEVLMREQRAIAAAAAGAFTNEAPAMIALCESLAERQQRQADMLLPFRDKLTEAAAKAAGTNDISQQIQQVQQFINATRGVMKGASESLRDVDAAGADTARAAAGGAARIWELVAPFSSVLEQDMLRQTNAILMTQDKQGMDPVLSDETYSTMQEEALRLTALFTNRFVASVPPEGIPAPPSTNGQPSAEGGLSKEDREKILVLADAAVGAQQDALKQLPADKPGSIRHQHEAHRLLTEIQALLPKQAQQSSGQQDEQNSQDKQDKSESQKSDQQQKQSQQQNATNNQQQAESQTNELAAPQPVSTNDQQNAEPPKETNALPMEVRAMLDRALMREREHEAEKRRRNQQMPMRPDMRDQ